jgi:hypothetical protein
MKWFQGTYTQRFNAMFKRRGHVFQGRYKAIPVQTDPLEGLKRTDKLHQLQGDERRAHNEKKAERLLAKALKALNCNEGDLLSMKQNQPAKQAVAWLLKSHTTVTVIWIAQRLQMGHRTNATRGINRIRNSSENKIQKLRTKMLQCTADPFF